MRKGVGDIDGGGSQQHPLHYGGIGTHHQQHQQQLVMHNLQASQVKINLH